jgi:glutamate synthase domain-containing protein 2
MSTPIILVIIFGSILLFLSFIIVKDLSQKKHTLKRNFPLVGRGRYIAEKFGPPIRQYFISNNREELPFNRGQRSWIYASAKGVNNYQGFGTDKDLFAPNHVFINPKMFPFRLESSHINHKDHDPYFMPCAKVMGLSHNRKKPFRPYSIINISAMSYGSLSKQAQESLNLGAAMVGAFHNTGEGGLSPYHQKGADVIFQIGTGYFGCGKTGDDGIRRFDLPTMENLVLNKYNKVKALEIKLSQGAKPGHGGVLPAAKNTVEIAGIRGVQPHTDVLSPSYHTAFGNVRELVDFIEMLAEKTGLPVGIKSAVGDLDYWHELAHIMKTEKKGPDFITIDGGEGGTGAAPPSFADHVALPWVFGFAEIYQLFQKHNLTQDIVFIGSGKLGFPSEVMKALAMGTDIVNIAREAMISIGCIQAQECHTGKCPTGIATQNKWLSGGIDPTLKSVRFAKYINTLRKETLEMTHACGYEHPCQMKMKDIDMSCGDNNRTVTMVEAFRYEKDEVSFTNMKDLHNCEYLGGLGQQPNALNKH